MDVFPLTLRLLADVDLKGRTVLKIINKMYAILCSVLSSQENLWRVRHEIGWMFMALAFFVVACIELTWKEYYPSEFSQR